MYIVIKLLIKADKLFPFKTWSIIWAVLSLALFGSVVCYEDHFLDANSFKLGGNKKCCSSMSLFHATFPCHLNPKLLFSFLPFPFQACLAVLFLSFCFTAFSAPSIFLSCSPACLLVTTLPNKLNLTRK